LALRVWTHASLTTVWQQEYGLFGPSGDRPVHRSGLFLDTRTPSFMGRNDLQIAMSGRIQRIKIAVSRRLQFNADSACQGEARLPDLVRGRRDQSPSIRDGRKTRLVRVGVGCSSGGSAFSSGPVRDESM
jgi:hypothetical protein